MLIMWYLLNQIHQKRLVSTFDMHQRLTPSSLTPSNNAGWSWDITCWLHVLEKKVCPKFLEPFELLTHYDKTYIQVHLQYTTFQAIFHH